jgi:hypothetical protein
MATLLTAGLLDGYVGKRITELCPLHFGTIGDKDNHCAHFVGHVLQLHHGVVHGTTCAGMSYDGKKHAAAGAVIRVNDIFNACDDLKEPCSTGCLIYYTLPENIHNGFMGTMSKKHVGICLGGYVYNYGNTHDAVRKDKLGDLDKLYGAKTIVRYTALPTGASPQSFADLQKLAVPVKK